MSEKEKLKISKLSARFNKARISYYDFEEAAEYIRSYDESLPPIIRRSLVISSIVTYARVYVESKSVDRSLQPRGKPYYKKVERDLQAVHYEAMDLRHKALAHSDAKHNRVARFKTDDGTDVWTQRHFVGYFVAKFDSFLKLVEHSCALALHDSELLLAELEKVDQGFKISVKISDKG